MYYIYNMPLEHKRLGAGVLKGYAGDKITVRFASGDVTFWFPKAFSCGLSATNDEDRARLNELAERWDRYVNHIEEPTEENAAEEMLARASESASAKAAEGAPAPTSAPAAASRGTASASPAPNAEKASKGQWIVTGIFFGYYALLLVLGCVGYLTDAFLNLFGAGKGDSVRLMSLLMLLLTPSVLLYVSVKFPISMPKIVHVVLFVAGVVLLVVPGFPVYYTAIKNLSIGEDLIMKISKAIAYPVGALGFIIAYAVSATRFGSKMKSSRMKLVQRAATAASDSGFLEKITAYDIHFLLLTFVLTFLLMDIASFIAVALLVIASILFAVFLLGAIAGGSDASFGSSGESDNEKVIRDDLGHKIKVRKTTLQERYDGVWYECWVDSSNTVYLTKDGKKFAKKP